MIDSNNYESIKSSVNERMREDKDLLDKLRTEICVLKPDVRRIQPRNTTSISLVGTDGGNNKLRFDPFLIQVIRVVDSSNNEYYTDVITPSTDIRDLDNKILVKKEIKFSALRELMEYLDVNSLTKLSPMIKISTPDKPISPSWVQVYREIVEWAILFKIIREKDFGTDTLVLFDGLLRCKVFSHDLFAKLRIGLEDSIRNQYEKNRRRIYIAGLAKHSSVLARYRLAMYIEDIMTTNYPCYVEIDRKIEEKAYIWNEYARGDDSNLENVTEINKYVAGKMFFVKFGNGSMDPIWPIDIFQSQTKESQLIIGCLLADAINGFPVPFYPLSLQKAHENAALVDFDFEIIQNHIFDAIRSILGDDATKVDMFRLQDSDPSSYRY